MTFLDLLSGINLLFILSSFIISVALIIALRQNEYVLAKGWKYLLPAVLSFAILQIINFFTDFSLYSTSRLLKEGLLFIFSFMLFLGLLIQYMAVQQAMSSRE